MLQVRRLLCALVCAWCLGGCNQQPAEQVSDKKPIPADETTEDGATDSANQPRVADSRPGSAPIIDADDIAGTDKAAPVPDTAESTAGSAVVRRLQNLINSSEPFQDAEVADDLNDQLSQADNILTRVASENRDALRQAGRQVRIGNGRSPNIVLIVADVLGHGEPGCYHHDSDRTPMIDRLATQGVRFEHFYTASQTPEISRYCLMTGRSMTEVVRGPTHSPFQGTRRRTLAESLWQAGYTTGFIGAWPSDDSTVPPAMAVAGYDTWIGTVGKDTETPYPDSVWSGASRLVLRSNSDGKNKVHANDFFVQEATALISQFQQARRPFFLHVSLKLFAEDTSEPKPADSVGSAPTAKQTGTAPNTALECFDRNLGILRDHLAEAGAPNTLFLFTSETTGPAPEAHSGVSRGLRSERGELYEGGLRVPFIASWPGVIPESEVCDQPCVVWDIFPTLVEISGMRRRPANLIGVSLGSVLRRQSQLPERLLFWESHETEPTQAVRLGKWKAVKPAGVKTIELYDLSSDPGETTDIAGQHPEIIGKVLQPQTK